MIKDLKNEDIQNLTKEKKVIFAYEMLEDDAIRDDNEESNTLDDITHSKEHYTTYFDYIKRKLEDEQQKVDSFKKLLGL